MTYIPAENDPKNAADGDPANRAEGGSGSRPPAREADTLDTRPMDTQSMTTDPIATEPTRGRDTGTISASADPAMTRPMPSVTGSQQRNRYDLSPDPATAPVEIAPWEQAPRAEPQATTAPTMQYPAQAPANYAASVPAGTSAPGHGGPGHGPAYGPGQGQPPGGHGGYPPAQPAPYGGIQGDTAQQAAPRTPRRDLTFGIAAGQLLRAVVLFALAVAIAYATLRTAPGQEIDERALLEGERALARIPAAWSPWIDLVPVGVSVFWGLLALVFALSTARWIPLLIAALSGVGAVITVQILKRDILAKAPLGIQESPMNSLPSGHTAAAATAAVIAVMVAPARLRGVVAFFGALTTAAAGVSTVLNGWHRPSDAVVSVLVVTCWAVLGALVLRCLIRPERWTPNRSIGSLVLGILFVLAATVGLTALLVLGLTTFPGLALATGAAAILGVSLLCAHQSVRALRPRRRVA